MSEAASLTRSRLTERDRHLIAFLATARYASTKQVARLFFPERHPETIRKRLAALTGGRVGDYLRRLQFRTFDGELVAVWALTPVGYLVAESVLGRKVTAPRADVSAAFLEHSVALNDLLVGLVTPSVDQRLESLRQAAAGSANPQRELNRRKEFAFARTTSLPFAWVSSDSARLPWSEYDVKDGKRRDRLIQPDAILELRAARRRIFVECEMGTHSIAAVSDDKPGATLAKAERYDDFMNGFADVAAKETFYARAYPDRWSAEVLFLVRTESRATSVNEALAGWRKARPACSLRAMAYTVEVALRLLNGVNPARAAAPSAAASGGTILSADDRAVLRAFYRGAIETLKLVRATARARQEKPPEYPRDTQAMLALIERIDAAAVGPK